LTTEVIIVGRGIAGLVLSWLLDRQGIEHIVLGRKEERRVFSLGETLPPSAIPLLSSLGLKEIFEELSIRKTKGYHSIWGSEKVTDHHFNFQDPTTHGLKLDKSEIMRYFEGLQREKLMYFTKIHKVQSSNEKGVCLDIETEQEEKTLRSKYIIDATGRNRAVLKSLNIQSKRYDQLTAYSCHLPSVKYDQLPYGVISEAFEQGWGIVSDIINEQNVLTLFTESSNPQQSQFRDYKQWKALLLGTKALKYFLTAYSDDVKIVGADASSSMPSSVAGENWLAIGDAAMAFDPLSSHGITNVLYTANKASELLLEVLQNGRTSDFHLYDISIKKIFEGYQMAKTQLYREEKRWSDHIFWKNMHQTMSAIP